MGVRDGAVQPADAEVEGNGEDKDDRGVAEGEEVADAERPFAVGDELAGGVVDRRDVVGIERMAHAERVGEDAGAEPEDLGAADVQVRGGCGPQQPQPATLSTAMVSAMPPTRSHSDGVRPRRILATRLNGAAIGSHLPVDAYPPTLEKMRGACNKVWLVVRSRSQE